MKIESVIRRKAGSSQTIGGITYHWNEQNGHVCEVDDPGHAEILLSHPEGWRAVAADANSKPKAGAEQGGDGEAGNSVDPATASDESRTTRAPRKSSRRKADEGQGIE